MSIIREFIENNPLPEGAYIFLDEAASPDNLRYLDLLHPPKNSLLPDAVVEIDGQPLLYLINQDLLAGADSGQTNLSEVLRTLACRADARFLGIVTPGIITIYPIEIIDVIPKPITTLDINASSFAIRDFLTGAEWPILQGQRSANTDKRWLDAFLLKLLNGAAETLRESFTHNELSNASVISLIGRALFSRFLTDREIVKERDIPLIAPQACHLADLYTTSSNAASTFRWLDETFNGDLLPLTPCADYDDFFNRLGDKAKKVCNVLSDIQYGAVLGQMELGWKGLRFKHIPVDVLSQVYENFYHKFLKDQAKKESVHYTPRRLAELLVDGAFSAIDVDRRHVARVLDPAVGAGVFLVLSLQRIVQERWRMTGRRPTRTEIRGILNNQLCGLDLNPEALKVAALSLYLAALDLDPVPQPLSDLKFKCLLGGVLHCVNDDSLKDEARLGLGSLSPRLHPNFPELLAEEQPSHGRHKYDIVIGNPPWTSIGGAKGAALEEVVRKSITARGFEPGVKVKRLLRYQTPDQPFLWKAMEWARKGGAIAFLIDAGLLFQPESQRMRELLFKAIRITGILNGTALRQTKVWPTVSAQFCLLVAKNEPPHPEDSFYYINPNVEPTFNDRGLFRIDPKEAVPVPCKLIQTTPTVFKTLFRGNGLDIDLINRLCAEPYMPMGEYLSKFGLEIEVGYIRGKVENRTRDASFLVGLKNLTGTDARNYIVHQEALYNWSYEPPKLQWPRRRETYQAPLLLFRKAAKLDVRERGALLCDFDVAYSESFYGISLNKVKSNRIADDLAAYLYVLSYSSLFVYFQLMTSSKFGVERETFHKEDYEKCPILPWRATKPELRVEIRRLAKKIAQGDEPWVDVDTVIREVYGLTKADQQLIADAMEYALPHAEKTDSAFARPSDKDIGNFLDSLAGLLTPFVGQRSIQIRHENMYGSKSFRFFSLRFGDSAIENNHAPLDKIAEILSVPLAASQIRIRLAPDSWLIGQLAQRRYWSRTQARLLALEWITSGFVEKSIC